MNPLQIIALMDAALTLSERAKTIYNEAVKEGIITPEEQAAQLARIDKLRNG
jgi:hypothetical protein